MHFLSENQKLLKHAQALSTGLTFWLTAFLHISCL